MKVTYGQRSGSPFQQHISRRLVAFAELVREPILDCRSIILKAIVPSTDGFIDVSDACALELDGSWDGVRVRCTHGGCPLYLEYFQTEDSS